MNFESFLAQAPQAPTDVGMPPGKTQLVIIAVYLLLLLFLGFFASRMFRGTKRDYLLASHSIGPFLLFTAMAMMPLPPRPETRYS